MMNIGRLALVVSLSISAGAIVACSSPAPLTPTEESHQTSGSGSAQGSSAPGSGASDNGSSSANAPAATNGDGGAPTDDASAPDDKGSGGKDVAPADPTCVSQCEAGLRAKCSGDDGFCSDMCSALPASEIACLIAAPTCDKSQWITCEGGSGGSGGKGTK